MSDQAPVKEKKQTNASKKELNQSQGSGRSRPKSKKGDPHQAPSQDVLPPGPNGDANDLNEQQQQLPLQQPPPLVQPALQQTSQFQLQSQPGDDMMIPQLRRDDVPKICVHHSMGFQFFCETCEEPICQQCTILGPHNNQLHRINRLTDSFRIRVLKVQEQIKVNLLGKRDQVLAQIHRIEYRIEEIKYVKTIVERDARAEFSSILERLKSAEGSKLALLHHEISQLQQDLDSINDVGSLFYDLTTGDNPDVCGFLLRSRQIYENIEYLVSKPFKVKIDVYPYDIPRELTELRLQLQRASAQKQLLEFKNEVIWKLVTEKKLDEEQIKADLERQAAEEINEWSKLVDRFSNELRKFQQVCYYCGCPMEKDNVNGTCAYNTPEQQQGTLSLFSPLLKDRVFSNEVPPQNFNQNSRHYFAKPLGYEAP